jgi:hypothetical protein
MQLIAIVVLFWQRRRVVPVIRRGWSWLKESGANVPSGSSRARATRLARQATVRGWRTVDTEANAARIARFVAWMRTLSSTGTVARPTSTPERTA